MTAKELFDKMLTENDEATSTEMMVAFAKYHVKRALVEASKQAKISFKNNKSNDYGIDVNSILDAYSTENIK